MIKNVIFDLDGTLLDTGEGIMESAAYAASQLGYPKLPFEELLDFVGPPVQQSFMKHYGCDREKAQKAADIFRDYYKSTALLKAKPYDGIYELCGILREKGLKMAVATYKREDYALTLLNHYHFGEYCDPMHGADNFNVLKKEDIVRMCIEEMGGTRENSVLVGDTLHDARGAMEAGTPFIGVAYGFGFTTEEDVAPYPCLGLARTPTEIADIIFS